jgi:hypothetical protein
MEPIISNGINPSWVLTGVVTIMVILLWRMLTTMQKEIKENADNIGKLSIVVGSHQTKHDSHEKKIDYHDEEFEKIRDSNSRLADEIVMKLRMSSK